MPEPPRAVSGPEIAARRSRSAWWDVAAIALLALIALGARLSSEPPFVDESAYLSQSYFATLFASGRHDDPAWLEYMAYDLPPGPKYLIGAALWMGGYHTPGPADARAWYRDTSRQFVPPAALTAARVPAVVLGMIGCLALYGLGVLASGRAVGMLAALLLIANPLYRLHARRAMSDVPCEAFMLLALFFGLWAWTRLLAGRSRGWAWLSIHAAGVCAGLALLCKLSGSLALMVIAGWTVLVLVMRVPFVRKLGFAAAAACAPLIAAATFVALNPFLTVHTGLRLPSNLASIERMSVFERVAMMKDLRLRVSADQKEMFPHNALNSPAEKVATTLVQGFGRFGPLGPAHSDSTRRFDIRQDWGALFWLPCVVAGGICAWGKARAQARSGAPPTWWAALVYFAIALAVVTAYIPMAWDRYQLAIQAPATLLAAGAIVAAFGGGRITGARLGRVAGLTRRPEVLVFAILLGSYAYFWQARDWNSASRLMVTYALVDRGTVAIDGLEDQTKDRAFFRSRYYTDKLPGFSLLATAPYALVKGVFRLPSHPLHVKGFAYWPADYWTTLGTSGLLSALTGVILFGLARDLGCVPRRAALVALAYGLATPAYAYATMSHGHQVTAFALLASFALLWRTGAPRPALRVGLAGFLAAYAAVVELQVGPVSAILGFYLLAQAIGRLRKPSVLGDFAIGALIPTLILLGYNQLAFGSPWDMGYFHHATKIFADVHSEANPLGLRLPNLARALPLLWGRHRGLLFYAPILALVPPGLVVLARRGYWGMAVVSSAVMAAVFAVNLSYPEWTGGWSTGPRLLVPLLPFAMLPVAGLLAAGGRWVTALAVALALAGGVLMLLFVAVGGRVPQYYTDPLVQAVWPLWRGEPVDGWVGEPFTRNAIRVLAPTFVEGLAPGRQWLQFLPLVVAQAVAIGLMVRFVKEAPAANRA